jgi:hypothetical protein
MPTPEPSAEKVAYEEPQPVEPPQPARQPQHQQLAAPNVWQPRNLSVNASVAHSVRLPPETKSRLMFLATVVAGESQTSIMVRALEREMDRMEKELNNGRNR